MNNERELNMDELDALTTDARKTDELDALTTDDLDKITGGTHYGYSRYRYGYRYY
jgi:hypothetical protein